MSLDSPSLNLPERSFPDPDVSGDHNGGAAPGLPDELPARRIRPSRACTVRAQQRIQELQAAEKRQRPEKKEQRRKKQKLLEVDREEDEGDDLDDGEEDEDVRDGSPVNLGECGGGSTVKIVTSLVAPPEPPQIPRWSLRSMWELGSILNFLHVFRPLLNIKAEFTAEELETALLTPNDTLSDVHIPLLKAIPPVTRMALNRDTWITVLCRKIRNWWHWVAEGDLPIVASQGLEIEVYKSLDPCIRVVILKALCDIRVEQEDVKNHIDNSLKQGIHLSTFRKERVGGDSHGLNYWYEDDALVGHRLYREIRKTEATKAKTKGSKILPNVTYLWETVATNFDEFQDVSEKLLISKNRTEASLGKKIKVDMLPDIEKEHKRKERLLKKQHRQALLLDNFLGVDGFVAGRSLRDRKPVRYTFDDYDRSINDAIKLTKNKPPSPEPSINRREPVNVEASENGGWAGSPRPFEQINNMMSPESSYDGEADEHMLESMDRSIRRRQRPERYSAKEFVETLSDNEADVDSEDDIVGEAVYDEEYLRKRKQRKKLSSGSEGDEEYRWDEDHAEDEEEEEEESLSISEEDSDKPLRSKKFPRRARRETTARSRSRSAVDDRPGLRRSTRAARSRINYKQYELSESDTETKRPVKSEKVDDPDEHDELNDGSDETENNEDFSMGSQESDENEDDAETKVNHTPPVDLNEAERIEKGESQLLDKANDRDQEEEVEGVGKRHFLDLNELAPVFGYEDCPNLVTKEEKKTDSS